MGIKKILKKVLGKKESVNEYKKKSQENALKLKKESK